MAKFYERLLQADSEKLVEAAYQQELEKALKDSGLTGKGN